MTVLRVIFFRLYESPRFLVAAGRPKEAMENLQLISKYNGEELDLNLRDVRDHFGTMTRRRSVTIAEEGEAESAPFLCVEESPSRPKTIFDARDSETSRISGSPPDSFDYNATGETTNNPLHSHSFITPALERADPFDTPLPEEEFERKPRPKRIQPRRARSSVYRASTALPSTVRRPLWAWFDKVGMVLAPEWIFTTLTMWATWFSMSLGEFSSAYEFTRD